MSPPLPVARKVATSCKALNRILIRVFCVGELYFYEALISFPRAALISAAYARNGFRFHGPPPQLARL